MVEIEEEDDEIDSREGLQNSEVLLYPVGLVHWNAFSARDNGSILAFDGKRWALDLRGDILGLLAYTLEHTIPCPSCVHALWLVGWSVASSM